MEAGVCISESNCGYCERNWDKAIVTKKYNASMNTHLTSEEGLLYKRKIIWTISHHAIWILKHYFVSVIRNHESEIFSINQLKAKFGKFNT